MTQILVIIGGGLIPYLGMYPLGGGLGFGVGFLVGMFWCVLLIELSRRKHA